MPWIAHVKALWAPSVEKAEMCIQILVVRRRQFRGDFPLIEPLKIRVLAMASRSLAR